MRAHMHAHTLLLFAFHAAVTSQDDTPVNVVSLRDIIAALVSVPDAGYFEQYLKKIGVAVE